MLLQSKAMPLRQPNYLRNMILAVTLAGTAVFVAWALFYTRYIVLASLIGIGFGVLISPVMGLLNQRFKIPRSLSAVLLVLLIIGGIAGMGYGIVALVSDQVSLLISRAPELAQTLQAQFSAFMSDKSWISDQLSSIDFSKAVEATLATLFAGVQTGFAAIAGVAFIVAIGLYTAVHAAGYVAGFLSAFPARSRDHVAHVMQRSARVLRQWFVGQVIVMTISGVLTAIGLFILGIEYWLLLGVLTAILGFIPYIGAVISGFFTVLITLGSDPGMVWWVLALYVGIQQLEGDVTIPLVMRGSIQLPEVHLIILMLILGSLFGIIGAFLAAPLLAVAREVYMLTYVPKMNRKRSPKMAA